MDINMPRKALWVFLRPLIQLITNLANPEIGDEWLAELKKFLRREPCWVVANQARKAKACLFRLFEDEIITIGATDGTEMITNSGVFNGHVDSDFVSLGLEVPGKPTLAMSVTVHEMAIKNGNYKTIYDSFHTDLDKLRMSKGQIKLFAETHYNRLRTVGGATFFLLTWGDEPVRKNRSNLFVAHVYGDSKGRLHIYVNNFSTNVWNDTLRLRFVIPQQ